jgi:hypothetical protein
MYVIMSISTYLKFAKEVGREAKHGGYETTLGMIISEALEHIGKVVLVALTVCFGLLIAVVKVDGYFLSAFFPQKKEVVQH